MIMAIKWSSEFTVPADDKDGITGVKFEDSGEAAIMYFCAEDNPQEFGGDGYFFIRLHSYDGRPEIAEHDKHRLFRSFMGRRVRVTVETIDKDTEDEK
jgi:hypothetical protein